MPHVSRTRFEMLTNQVGKEPTGMYYDKTNDRCVGVDPSGNIVEIPVSMGSNQACGDFIRRNGSHWELMRMDGQDPVFINFLKQSAVAIHAKNTMAIVTAANAQQDFFHVNNNYFELAQGVGALGANTLLAAVGLTPGAGGWLLTLDNTATDSIEITRGIVHGSAQAYTTGTDSFFVRAAFLVGTLANITHLKVGFRNLAAYATASTQAECLAAYDDKAMFGINNNGGRLGRCTSLATVDAELNAAHAVVTAGDAIALEVSINAERLVVCKIGHATPATADYPGYEAARLAAIADLATDVTIEATAHTCTTGIVHVPSIIVGASGAGACDWRLMSFECSLNE